MNKTAVALAADSAVTISSGRGGIKTYETINKLFELIRGSNVGLMIYSNAELNGIPWESVVKTYRAERPGLSAPYLEDYVEDFSSFLASSDELLPRETDTELFLSTAYDHLLKIFRGVIDNQSSWVTSSGKVVKSRLLAALRAALDSAESATDQASDAPWSGELTFDRLKAQFGADVAGLIDDLFERFSLTRSDASRLRDFVLTAMRKCLAEPARPGSSLLVLAVVTIYQRFTRLKSEAESRVYFASLTRAYGRPRQRSPDTLRRLLRTNKRWAS